MNAPESNIKFVPKQALTPTPQLYDELVSDSMENLAKASLTFAPTIADGAVINDDGCGTGAASAAVAAAIAGRGLNSVSIKATDINEDALAVYRKRAAEGHWNAEAVNMNAESLGFADDTFTLSIGNALLFVLPTDGVKAVEEVHRTLKPGGTAIFNSWKYVPNMQPVQAAAKETRPEGTPLPRAGLDKWSRADFLESIVEKGGFEKSKIVMKESPVSVTVAKMDRYVRMLWSFIGGTSTAGWLESDEENWDKALEIVEREVRKTEGYRELPDGRSHLQFIANIAIATK